MEGMNDQDYALKDNSTYSSDATTFAEYKASVVLWKVCSPCILLLGGFGNIATIFVMRRIKDHNSSQYAILMALAVFDFFLLYTSLLCEWVRHIFYIDAWNFNTPMCKLQKWLIYSCNTTSAWLVTCVTVQRTMAVLWPHRMRVICTVRRTWMVIAAVVLAVFSLYFHLMIGMEISGENRCDAMAGLYGYFYRHIFPWVDITLGSLLTSTCQIVCDVILSFTLLQATSATSSKAVHAVSNVSGSVGGSSHHHGGGGGDIRRKRASKTMVMILTLSCAFIGLTLPVYGFYIYWYKDEQANMMQPPRVLARLKLVSTATHLLWYVNSAVNFLFYCLTGSKYRSEFLALFHCCGVFSAADAASSSSSVGGSGPVSSSMSMSLSSSGVGWRGGKACDGGTPLPTLSGSS